MIDANKEYLKKLQRKNLWHHVWRLQCTIQSTVIMTLWRKLVEDTCFKKESSRGSKNLWKSVRVGGLWEKWGLKWNLFHYLSVYSHAFEIWIHLFRAWFFCLNFRQFSKSRLFAYVLWFYGWFSHPYSDKFWVLSYNIAFATLLFLNLQNLKYATTTEKRVRTVRELFCVRRAVFRVNHEASV